MDAVTDRTLYLVDASLYVFRAWHSIPGDFVDVDGNPVNAVHGFTRFICDLIERTRPTHIMLAFDGSLDSSFRNAIYPDYKANRDRPPPELKHQFTLCQAIATAMGLVTLVDDTFEADDLIGSASWVARAEGYRSVIVSADKDFGQLLGARDEQWDFARNQRWGPAGVHARLGVHPPQVADYLALCGDSVDNIPGVPGIGAKTAATLLARFGSLDQLLEHIEEVPFLSIRGAKSCAARLRQHTAMARTCRRLTRIALDAPVPPHTGNLARRLPDHARLDELVRHLRMGPLTRDRLRRVCNDTAEPSPETFP